MMFAASDIQENILVDAYIINENQNHARQKLKGIKWYNGVSCVTKAIFQF